MQALYYNTVLLVASLTTATADDDPRLQLPTRSSQLLPSFQNPLATYRPKFRYWLPDASVPVSAVEDDIAALAGAGAGGLEFLPFYNYGMPPISTDWSIYGFGMSAFSGVFKAALNATAAHGLVFDFALGANQGAGVPSVPETEGLAMELVYGARTIEAGAKVNSLPKPEIHFNYESLQGFIIAPELWGGNDLVAVLAAQVVSNQARKGRGGDTRLVVLDEQSVVDLTSSAKNGTLQWIAPPAGSNSSWVVMAFYQRYTNERSSVSVANAKTWIGNGSWLVDHFSEAGARRTTSFWDEHILNDPDIRRLIKEVGKYAWEDSMEMMASLWWTPDFLRRFESARGYSAIKYLPVFFQASNLWNSYSAPYNTTYTFNAGAPDGGRRPVEDYRLTLNEGYQGFLRHYQSWAQSNGLEHSSQPAYNMPLDMFADIPLVGAPELESLGFSESIDVYRQFTGAAHISSRNVISTEIGAQRIGAYAQAIPSLVALFQDSFVAGVNTLVIHGYPYGGAYPGTTWPGYTPFQYEFGEMWGPRQPSWQHFNDTLLFAARNTEIMTTGVAKVDLAFYIWKTPWSPSPVYQALDLNAAGYTYEYLGADNLASQEAIVRDKVLAPDGPAYKGLVVYNQTKITPAASAALLKFAEAGLPIFIVGSVPNMSVGTVSDDIVAANMETLTSGKFTNVVRTPQGPVTPALLARAGVAPRTTVKGAQDGQNTTQIYTAWRSDVKKSTEFVYILNKGQDSSFILSFVLPNSSIPSVLDTWTGEQTLLPSYERRSDSITVNVTLAKQESMIIAFGTQGATAGPLGVSMPVPKSPLATQTLGPWNLTVDSYAAPTTLKTTSVSANRTKITISNPLRALVPWTRIAGLEHVSGMGTYRTTFTIPVNTNASDVTYTLHFTGRVLNTLRAFINGLPTPPVDPAAPGRGRDVSLLVRPGENEIAVEVSTSLFNAVKSRWEELLSIGMGPRAPKVYRDGKWAEFGLVGEVVIKGWRTVDAL